MSFKCAKDALNETYFSNLMIFSRQFIIMSSGSGGNLKEVHLDWIAGIIFTK